MEVPKLQLDHPIHHADCCLSLSNRLLDTLIGIFTETSPSSPATPRQHRTILSVGSGTGLLETLLNDRVEHHTSGPGGGDDDDASDGSIRLTVEGVEVQQPDSQPGVNKYLPEPLIHTIRSSSDVSPRLGDEDFAGLMFVYPRQPTLVTAYIKSLNDSNEESRVDSNVAIVVWLGPRADWSCFQSCFKDKQGNEPAIQILAGEEGGLKDYEIMAVMRFLRPTS